MSELISGKEALIALANGEEVEYKEVGCSDWNYDIENLVLSWIKHDHYQFRIKPRTIAINGIEVPASAEDEDYHHQGIWVLNSLEPKEYGYVVLDITDELPRYWWKSEEEIKQVVAALRKVLGGAQ